MARVEDRDDFVEEPIGCLPPGSIFQISGFSGLITAMKNGVKEKNDFTYVEIETGIPHGVNLDVIVLYYPKAFIKTIEDGPEGAHLDIPKIEGKSFGKLLPGAIFRYIDLRDCKAHTCLKVDIDSKASFFVALDLESGEFRGLEPETVVYHFPSARILLASPATLPIINDEDCAV